MYLHLLKKKEQFAFLNIAYVTVNADGEFHENEEKIISLFMSELGIRKVKFKDRIDLKEEAKKFKSKKSKKIAILELMVLIMADRLFHKKEREIANFLIKEFNLKNSYMDVCLDWSKMLIAIRDQGRSLINL